MSIRYLEDTLIVANLIVSVIVYYSPINDSRMCIAVARANLFGFLIYLNYFVFPSMILRWREFAHSHWSDSERALQIRITSYSELLPRIRLLLPPLGNKAGIFGLKVPRFVVL